MASSDGRPGCDSQSLSGYVALIVCGVLVLGLMPLSVTRVDVAQTIEPQVTNAELVQVVEMLSEPPIAVPAITEIPISKPRAERAGDATGQTSRLFQRLRAIDAQQRHQTRPAVNPLRDPGSQLKRKGQRPGAAERLFDEFP